MFNRFKKKNKVTKPLLKKPRTIICIPGIWNDSSELIAAIIENNENEFIFAGNVLLNLKTKVGYELEICERDLRMKDSFKFAGRVNQVSEEFLNKIDQHKSVVYLIGETGDAESAKTIAEAGLAVLKSGGIGIKIESTGKAFTKELWSDLIVDFQESNLYQMYVLDSISDGKGRTYSCGMHNLGLKDIIIYNEAFQEAVNIISIFGHYLLIEKPEIENNQTFSAQEEAPVFVISEEKNQPNSGDEFFENPYGMWKLERKVNG
ncbi:MAG: hypothetical protein ACI8ZM_004458 [Crocinitomix sp.]|jgi:hypothetical protein